MVRTIGIGCQDFEKVRKERLFYIDKTNFIREWWENADDVTLITRPRRFGKTLNMSMLEKFFSIQYAGQGELFQGLKIWEDEKYRKLQGTYPVLGISFADVKETTYEQVRKRICRMIKAVYNKFDFLLKSDFLNENDRHIFVAPGTECWLHYVSAPCGGNRFPGEVVDEYGGSDPLEEMILIRNYELGMNQLHFPTAVISYTERDSLKTRRWS